MTDIPAEDIGAKLKQLIQNARDTGDSLRILSEGKIIAFLLPVSTAEEAEDMIDAIEADAVLDEIEAGKTTTVPWSQVEREIDEKLRGAHGDAV